MNILSIDNSTGFSSEGNEKFHKDLVKKSMPRAFTLPKQSVFLSDIFKKTLNDNRKQNRVIYALPTKPFDIDENKSSISVPVDSWTETYSEAELVTKLRLVSRDVIDRLKSFVSLEEDWDSYGAQKISYGTIVTAISFFLNVVSRNFGLPQPFISPSPSGGIDFEWGTCSSILNHRIPEVGNDFFVYAIKNKSNGERPKRIVNKVTNVSDMEQVVLNWFESI
jgi:hypothetical protein